MAPKKAEEGPKGAARFGRVKNNLKMGIVGLPNVGKSSLFNILTEQVRAVARWLAAAASDAHPLTAADTYCWMYCVHTLSAEHSSRKLPLL